MQVGCRLAGVHLLGEQGQQLGIAVQVHQHLLGLGFKLVRGHGHCHPGLRVVLRVIQGFGLGEGLQPDGQLDAVGIQLARHRALPGGFRCVQVKEHALHRRPGGVLPGEQRHQQPAVAAVHIARAAKEGGSQLLILLVGQHLHVHDGLAVLGKDDLGFLLALHDAHTAQMADVRLRAGQKGIQQGVGGQIQHAESAAGFLRLQRNLQAGAILHLLVQLFIQGVFRGQAGQHAQHQDSREQEGNDSFHGVSSLMDSSMTVKGLLSWVTTGTLSPSVRASRPRSCNTSLRISSGSCSK